MPKYTSRFSDQWLDRKKHPTWTWLEKVDGDDSNARCNLCNTNFDVSNMGVCSIPSHEKGKKHRGYCDMKSQSLAQHFKRVTTEAQAIPATHTSTDQPSTIGSTSPNDPPIVTSSICRLTFSVPSSTAKKFLLI